MNTSGAYTKNYNSLYRGIIEDNVDPENLGRCRVRVPSIHGELNYPVSILPWARPLVLSPVSKNKGSINLPDIGDIVWVLFEGSNKEFPVYLGGTYATGDLEINNDIVDFYIEEDSKISYHRKDKKYTIQTGESKITVSPDSITIEGNLTIKGDLEVSGNTILNNLTVKGSYNKEGGHS